MFTDLQTNFAAVNIHSVLRMKTRHLNLFFLVYVTFRSANSDPFDFQQAFLNRLHLTTNVLPLLMLPKPKFIPIKVQRKLRIRVKLLQD